MPTTPRPKPAPWIEHKQTIRHGWTLPFVGLEWTFQWAAHLMGKWAFLEVLQYSGALSVLFAVGSYFWESGDRLKQKHYQAWQVINTAQGKGGSGGRIEALQELNADHVPLVGVDVSEAFLVGIKLRNASLPRANISAADARDSDWTGSNFDFGDLHSANLRNSIFRNVRLTHAQLEGCDLTGADLSKADLSGANLKGADLRSANLSGMRWAGIESIEEANIHGVRNAPEGFAKWALAHGAIEAANAQ